MLVRRIELLFPVKTYEIFKYRENKFALYENNELLAMRSDLMKVESILKSRINNRI